MTWNPKSGEQEIDLSIAKYSSIQQEQRSAGLSYKQTPNKNSIENFEPRPRLKLLCFFAVLGWFQLVFGSILMAEMGLFFGD